jgi:hypothetical protein
VHEIIQFHKSPQKAFDNIDKDKKGYLNFEDFKKELNKFDVENEK